MRLTRKAQYGVLFALYLSRSGRVSVDVAAANLGVSRLFLHQVARYLRIGGIITSHRGVNGGFELKGNPTVGEVIAVLSPTKLLSETERNLYQKGDSDARAFVSFVRNLSNAMAPLLNRSIRNIGQELVANEMAKLNRINDASAVN